MTCQTGYARVRDPVRQGNQGEVPIAQVAAEPEAQMGGLGRQTASWVAESHVAVRWTRRVAMGAVAVSERVAG